MAVAMDDEVADATRNANELVQEFVDSRGQQLATDRRRGVLRGVKLLGLVSKNGRLYRERALRAAMHLYDGAKVNVNHPTGDPLGPRDYRDRLGVIRNVVLRAGDGLFGDLHYNPNHALAEQLAWDAEHAPENVGLSHNVAARTTREGDKLVVESIARVHSVDLVADPATTSGLYEQTAPPARESDAETPAVAEAVEDPGVEPAEPDELTALREEVAALRKAELIRRVLQEHGFSGIDDEAVDAALIGAMEQAADEAAIIGLVRQRAELVERVRAASTGPAVCESRATDPLGERDAEQIDDVAGFLRAVTRRT